MPGNSPQVWLVPFAFLEMEAAHKRRAAVAREIAGLSATNSGQRLYVVYDRAGPFPSGPYKVLALRNLAENILSFDALQTLFDTF